MTAALPASHAFGNTSTAPSCAALNFFALSRNDSSVMSILPGRRSPTEEEASSGHRQKPCAGSRPQFKHHAETGSYAWGVSVRGSTSVVGWIPRAFANTRLSSFSIDEPVRLPLTVRVPKISSEVCTSIGSAAAPSFAASSALSVPRAMAATR